MAKKAGLGWVPGIESIDFQRDDIGAKLEFTLQQIKDDIDRGEIVSPESTLGHGYESMLENLIQSRFGLKTFIDFTSFAIAAIMPFYINRHHVLADPMFRGIDIEDQQKFLRSLKNQKGTVDLEKAVVTGIFSEYHHHFHLNVYVLFTTFDMSVREVAAIMLHEIGHAFTWYEFADRLMSTNQILSEIAFEKEIDPKKREYVLRELSAEWGMGIKDMEDIQEEDNRVIFGFRLFKKFVKVVNSQLKNAKYDQTSSEQLADNFASKFGYGRELIEALEHFYIATPEKSSFVYFLTFIFEFIFFQLGGVCALIIGLTLAPVALFFALFCVLLNIFLGENYIDYTYDKLKMRYKRIRDQYIDLIEKIKLPKDEMVSVIADIHHIDAIIKDTRIYTGPVSLVANFLSSANRSAKESILMQQLLEELAHNDLFLKGAELKIAF